MPKSRTVAVDLPDWPYDSLNTILFAEAAAAFEELTLSGGVDQLRVQTPVADVAGRLHFRHTGPQRLGSRPATPAAALRSAAPRTAQRHSRGTPLR
jgi:hypothetical protein